MLSQGRFHTLQTSGLLAKFQPTPSLTGNYDSIIVSLTPRGLLQAIVYTHKLEGHDCWSFVSDGLAALGQKEIVITIRREQNQPLPESVFEWFEVLYTFVQTKPIHDFGVISSPNFQFLDRSDFIGFVHTNPILLGDLPPKALPEKYLQAIAFTKPELDVILRYGALRFLSHLGDSANYFPCPPWIDTRRNTVISLDDLSKSFVKQCPFIETGSGFHAVKVGNNVHAYMSSTMAQVLTESLKQLAIQTPFVLPCGLLDSADSCFIWKNDQSMPKAIGLELNRTNLCFLGFCPLPESEFLLQPCEDGYFLMLSHKDLVRVRDSLATRQSITLSTETGCNFYLNMKQDLYHDDAKDRVFIVPCAGPMT